MAATLLRPVVLFFLIIQIQGRILKLNSSENNLVSDGVDTLVGNRTSEAIGAPCIPNTCDHQYGFLPCAENVAGYVYQILVYQGLLIFGEKQIGSGSKVLFEILGVGKFGGIVFRILMSLPSMMLMIVSGVFSTKDTAQSQVSLGVGIYAGITVFSLTLQWGICVIFGRRELLMSKPDDEANELQQKSCFPERLAALKDTGVIIDSETRSTAGIVVLSLVPYVVVQLVNVFHTSSGNRIMTLIALIVSCLSLLSYFIYQILNPWIQERSLDYAKYGRTIPDAELVKGFMKWGNTRAEAELIARFQKSSHENESSELHLPPELFVQLRKLWDERDENDSKELDQIMAKFLKHAQTKLLKSEALITPDGNPNVECIKILFEQYDADNNNTMSLPALKQLFSSVKFGELQAKSERIIMNLFDEFDTNRDHVISEQEFIKGVSKWLKKAVSVAKTQDTSKAIDEFEKIMWPVLDKWALTISVFQLTLGILMLTFLGGPLITTILQLSFAMNFPSFTISYIIVPCAMNARAAITSLMPASKKNERSASLTFSEIYGAVIMNNIAGLTTLLAIVYAKDLTWDFSAEVLTILFVGGVIGILAYRCTTYPLWTSILAFALYPFSLTLYYFVQVFMSWN